MGARTYATGGVAIRSDIAFVGLAEATRTAEIVLLRRLDREADRGRLLLERTRPGESQPYMRISRTRAGYFFEHVAGLDLDVAGHGRQLTVTRLVPDLGEDEIQHILLDQLLPLVFAQLGHISFHGSAVALDERGICFLADSTVGKSTLAAALCMHGGARVLADDHVVLGERGDAYFLQPTSTSVRLWSESAAALFAAEARGTKARFELARASRPAPLAAIALLEAGTASQELPVVCSMLRSRDAIVGVATHLDRLDPTDRSALRRELDGLAALVGRVPVARMRVVRSLDRLEEVAVALRRWAQELPRSATPNNDSTS